MRRVLAVCVLIALRGRAHDDDVYRSPYRVEFTHPVSELIGDLERTERGDARLEAEVPYHQWYAPPTGTPCAVRAASTENCCRAALEDIGRPQSPRRQCPPPRRGGRGRSRDPVPPRLTEAADR